MPYTSRDFPGQMVAPRGYLEADWGDLLWAALTVGRPNTAYVLAHGEASYHEALVQAVAGTHGAGRAAARRGAAPDARVPIARPDRAGAVSYFLGMGVCKLFADRLLRTTWLLHLDVFQHQLDPVLLGGRSRPDLVGLDDVGAWHAFECKGRSSVPNAEERKKAKLQAERLVRVDLTDCSLHVGAISYFRQDRLEFHWRDPEPEEAEKLDPLEVNLPDDAWRHYYAPALALDNGGGKVAMSDARASADVDVEIHPEIREWLVMGEWAAARARAQGIGGLMQETGFRADGLKVTAGESWPREREAQRVGA